MNDCDEGYRAGLQKMRDLSYKRIEELEAKLGEYNLIWQAYELDKVVTELKRQNDE